MTKKLALFVILCALVFTAIPAGVYADTDYSEYSNECIHFGLNLRTDHKKPSAEKPKGVVLSDYDTYFYDKKAYKKDDKVIYLTFDCGYENGNTPKILDTLKAKNVKAIFFVTKPYIKENPKLVKRMKEEGHLVGNHTSTHPSLPDCSLDRIKREMNNCKKMMKKKTGYDMDPFMRPPMGHYSVRVMKLLQDMGYNTMLWSLAIYDYEEDDQPGADYVIDKFKKHHFCGMMPLLHVISSSDAEALPDIIDEMEDEGYRFGMVTDFLPVESKDDKAAEATTAAQSTEATKSTEAAKSTSKPAKKDKKK
jgi:peptidoglycan-N-acetylmuramic acid deacetylase